MITAMTTARNQLTASTNRAVKPRRPAETDAGKSDGVAVVASQDPDALPGRGRWADCY